MILGPVVYAETLLMADGLWRSIRNTVTCRIRKAPLRLTIDQLRSARSTQRASVASYKLLPKKSNDSARDAISQNNSIVITVCNLACAAVFVLRLNLMAPCA